MRRREFIATLGGAVAVSYNAARAQTRRVPIVGYAGIASPEADRPFIEALRRGLREVGLIDGQNVRIESRHAGGDFTKAEAVVRELLALNVDVFIAPGPAAARVLRRMTTLPIVALQLMSGQSDPELYESLARPGGNLTGFSSMGEDLSAKRIGIVRELLPNLTTIGVLHNGTDRNFRDWGVATEAAARAQGLAVSRQAMSEPSVAEVGRSMAAMRKDGAGAVIVIRDFMITSLANEIVAAALEARIAVIAEHRDFVTAGAMLSYGPDVFDLFRRAGGHVERILKGMKPADLAIQLPVKFEMVLNLKTAKALGLTIPTMVLAQVDEVIE